MPPPRCRRAGEARPVGCDRARRASWLAPHQPCHFCKAAGLVNAAHRLEQHRRIPAQQRFHQTLELGFHLFPADGIVRIAQGRGHFHMQRLTAGQFHIHYRGVAPEFRIDGQLHRLGDLSQLWVRHPLRGKVPGRALMAAQPQGCDVGDAELGL